MGKPGTERIYNTAFPNRDDVILWDIFPVADGSELKLVFESKNSDWKQGVWLMCDRGIVVNGIESRSAEIWFDQPLEEVSFTCLTENGLVSIYNIWNRGLGTNSQSHSSGMLVEEFSNGRTYSCNDIGFDTAFDKLVFRIEVES